MLALATAAFFVFGVVLVIVGANQAQLASALSLDLTRSGLLASALAVGLGLGVAGSGPLVDRLPRRPIFVVAAALAGVAFLSVDAGIGFPRLLLTLAVAGLGAGAYETLFNSAVAERYRERAARPISGIHAAATLGAVLGAPVLATITARGGFVTSFRATGVLLLALALAGLAVRLPDSKRGQTGPGRRGEALSPARLAPFALVAFAYVGVEGAVTLFAVPFAVDQGLPGSRGIQGISAFWLGLLVGRVAFLAHRGSPGPGWLGVAGLALAAVLGASVVSRTGSVEFVLALAGLASSVVFPLVVALTAQRFPESPGTATGLVVGFGSLGGFALPWWTGVVGDAVGAQLAVGALAVWGLLIATAARISRGIR